MIHAKSTTGQLSKLTFALSVPGRPLRSAHLDFPVVPTGKVDGTVFVLKGDSEQAASNAQLQLVDASGEVVQEVKSSFLTPLVHFDLTGKTCQKIVNYLYYLIFY